MKTQRNEILDTNLIANLLSEEAVKFLRAQGSVLVDPKLEQTARKSRANFGMTIAECNDLCEFLRGAFNAADADGARVWIECV